MPQPPFSHPSGMASAYLALGANLGDRLANLRASCAGLAAGGVQIEARSGVFETDAVGTLPQPAYLNAAIRIRTALPPMALLALAMDVERQLGRERSRPMRWAPRTADIDLLIYEDVVMDAHGLTLPHPRLLERAFVRVPLAQVAIPGLRHPLTADALDAAALSVGVRPWPGAL